MKHEVALEPIIASSDHTLVIQIGSVCCALKCPDDEVYRCLQRQYHPFLTGDAPDISIELAGTERIRPDALGDALGETRFIHEGNSFRTTSQIISGRYNLEHHAISITGEKSLVDPDIEYNHLNRLISLVYYSACKVKYNNGLPPALLVHTCGIIRYGQAILFAGPSETGKTTIAKLCGEQHGEVINDEMLLLSLPAPGGNIVSVQSAPIIGGFTARRNISAPLRCVLLLKKGSRTMVRYLDKAEAYLRFMRQIITPAYIGQKSSRACYSIMADFSTEIIRTTPVYELEFNLDNEALWRVVMDLEEMV